MREKLYTIYDMRAANGDTENAMVLETCHSLGEAKQRIKDDWGEGVIVSYDIKQNPLTGEETLENEHVDSIMGGF